MTENTKSRGQHFLESMMKESDAYSSMEMIESFVEKGLSLEHVPLQPLYLALKSLPPQQVTEYLPRLSKEQRFLMQDLDVWSKDQLDPDEFEFWVQSYASCLDDEVRTEFAQGIPFLLYLKGRFNIWTFDQEDPQYPDHDNYFLTDDGLLLFEFFDDFEYISEVRALIREMYSEMGVEHAYSWLFKMVSESALIMIEDEYQYKKSRLSDVGFVDYYDALEIDSPFINMSFLENYLRKKQKLSVGVHQFSKQQVLPKKALAPFRDSFSRFDQELDKVTDPQRKEYLQFNFLRLVNGNVALKGSFKDGAIAINRAGEKTKNLLLLGFDYCLEEGKKQGLFTLEEDQSLFDLLDFTEIFRIGNSLIRFVQNDLKKALRLNQVDEEETFFGGILNEFLDHSFATPCELVRDFSSQPEAITEWKTYVVWQDLALGFVELLPFVAKLYHTFLPLKVEGRLQDHFYLNYNVDQIDVESVLASSFANHLLVGKGILSQELVNEGKLGLTLDEFRQFCSFLLTADGQLNEKEALPFIVEFKKSFGMEDVHRFNEYFLSLLKSQLEGYDYKHLADDDFAHVGGPIILKGAKDLS